MMGDTQSLLARILDHPRVKAYGKGRALNIGDTE